MLTSDGRSQSLSERVTGSREASTPTSDLAEMLSDMASRFMRCKTHRARLSLIKEAQTLANRLRYAPDRSMVRGTSEWKQAIIDDPRSCRVLEVVYGVHYSTISRIKKQGVARVAGVGVVA